MWIFSLVTILAMAHTVKWSHEFVMKHDADFRDATKQVWFRNYAKSARNHMRVLNWTATFGVAVLTVVTVWAFIG
jgi:hypothetical protein